MSDYKDRGIMKWAPFDALNGHTSIIEDMIYNMNKKQKRIVSSDEYEEFNEIVEKAVSENKAISLDYFVDGYTINTFGKIKKIDQTYKTLILDTGEKIEFDSVMKVKLVK